MGLTPRPPLAEVLVKCVVVGLASLLLAGGLADAWLAASGRETASDWLRRHPRWFWEPAWALACFVLWLAVHLCGRPKGD